MTAKQLTARGVKMRLSRAGVDYSKLTITEHTLVSQRVDIAYTGPWRERTMIRITADRDERRGSRNVLFDAGFACAPYPEYDEWSA